MLNKAEDGPSVAMIDGGAWDCRVDENLAVCEAATLADLKADKCDSDRILPLSVC